MLHRLRRYNEASGALLTSTLMDYALPMAEHNPALIADTIKTPSPLNPPGARGVGEAGCIARRRRAGCAGATGHHNYRHATHAGKGVGAGDYHQSKVKPMEYDATGTTGVGLIHMEENCVIIVFEKRRTYVNHCNRRTFPGLWVQRGDDEKCPQSKRGL